ncbi:MAG TPA: dTDP-glucose 4,6-dehydratase [Candidatus Omnitrophota bacterium]|nr:dTDP-glucose 4,6-dehydratase [Candidatus Omnitrophota bacterium]HRZ15181.1 dTDP-glucose 4,6-dehydratase [Candidatus Omnitrophota bacterium]
MKKILVTGAAGFIGSEFVRQGARAGTKMAVVDCLTYAGDLKRLAPARQAISFHKVNICDSRRLKQVFEKERPEAVVHFAAESHVDRSIADATPFMDTNVTGTQVLLDVCRRYPVKKFVHISTDEVYGEIEKGTFREDSPFNPNSPYSVSKAAADMLARAYFRTYGLPAVVVRPSNNYGPWQYPEKLIPVVIRQALQNKKVPVYARGLNVREWLFVGDCAQAVWQVLRKAVPGSVYNAGSGQERRNIDTVKAILKLLGQPASLIEFVADRPGHDIRYSLDCSKIRRELGWKAATTFSQGIAQTVDWYRAYFKDRR